jgi:hypothetical protein
LSLTQVRDQAISLGLFDSKKYNSFLNQTLQEKVQLPEKPNSIEPMSLKEDTDLKDETLEERIEEDNVEITLENNEIEVTDNKNDCFCFSELENKFTIIIPPNAKKEDLLELKEFLSQENQ